MICDSGEDTVCTNFYTKDKKQTFYYVSGYMETRDFYFLSCGTYKKRTVFAFLFKKYPSLYTPSDKIMI